MRSMYLKEADSGDLIDVSKLDQLLNPLSPTIAGRRQAGEEEQEEESFYKDQLVFPSGEPLPRCWKDKNTQIQ
jgi:hypothetical protein